MTAPPGTGPNRESTESLFDTLPDPVLSYGSERSGGPDSSPDALVLHMVNPAFASTFDVDRDWVGTPLERVTVAGRIVSDTGDAADANDREKNPRCHPRNNQLDGSIRTASLG